MDTETFIIEIVIDFTLSAYKGILFIIREKLGILFGGYMKMKKEKICLSIILFLVLLSMAGCGKDPQINTPDKQQDDIVETIQWNVSHSPMLEQYEIATIDDGKIYACRYVKEGLNISIFATDTVELIKTYEIPDVTELKSISINSTGQICIFGSTEDGDVLWKVAPDGEISSIEDIEVENLGLFPSLKSFYADGNGYYYLWYEMSVPCADVYEGGEEDVYTRLDRIYVKDQQMNTIIYEEVPDSDRNKLLSFAFDEDGIPVLFAKDEEGCYVRRVRTADIEKYEAYRLETSELPDLEYCKNISYTKNGVLYTRNGALYLYHMSDSLNEKLLDLAAVGIWEEDIIYLGRRDDTIEIIDNYKNLQQSEYTAVKEGEDQRIQLTLGVMTLQPETREIIAAFNRYQNEVTITPIVYVDGYDYDAGYEKLTMEVIQGKAPDLICVDGIEYESLANVGAFADLYRFMQQDAELNAENLVSSVLNVYEMKGHLYTIAPAFRIFTMWGAGSVVDGRKGCNLEEMIQILQDNGGDINSIYGFSADEDPLTTLCAFNMDNFVNWGDGICDFTGEEFQQVLSFVKEYEGKYHESMYLDIRSGDILFTLGLISSVEDCRLASELYGENIQFIGYPTVNGTGSAAFFAGDEVAINSKSKYQEEAWEFVKYYVQNGYSKTAFPLVKEQFDKMLEESVNEFIEDGERTAKIYYSEWNVITIMAFQCEPEDVEAIRELVDGVSDKYKYNIEIQKVIDEEVGAYLHDQKDMEEVCSIIQSRVQIYLDEKQ